MNAEINKKEEKYIVEIINAAEGGLGGREINNALKLRMRRRAPSERTVRRILDALIKKGAISRTGKNRYAKYQRVEAPVSGTKDDDKPVIPVSDEGKSIQEYVRRPVQGRTPVGYDPEFLEDYIPNYTYYLPERTRQDLFHIGEIKEANLPEGSTYAPETVNRLLVDLSWASSRMEGNTYEQLEAKKLIEDGVIASDKDQLEADMILNHKEAINMLLESAQDIDYNMYTFLSLHQLLSDNLLGDQEDCGRLRKKIVEISGSVYRPLGVPQQVEDFFRMFLNKARDIEDPFEQSFFTMVHLPHLQPFTDVNKRTARLGANIPLIRNKLCPLSFIDVPDKEYIEGNLGVYELNDYRLLQDVYVWAYERSCREYNLLRRQIATRDPYRTKYKNLIFSVTGQIIRDKLEPTGACILGLVQGRIDSADTDRFIHMVKEELRTRTEIGLIRYGVSKEQFAAWLQHPVSGRSAQDAAPTVSQ